MDFSQVTDMLNLKEASGNTQSSLEELEHLKRENLRLKTRVRDLEKAADTDPLLPVYNRRAFMREIDRARNVMGRYDILSSLIYFDLNNFKTINDQYGHAIGDDILRVVGRALTEGVRDCDMVARLGGDEFGVLLFKTDKIIARAKASALACRVAEQAVRLSSGGHVTISAAWGISSCEIDDTAEQILSRADRAMYVAKQKVA